MATDAATGHRGSPLPDHPAEHVRPATTEDVSEIADLARMALDELTPLRGGSVWRAQEARREPVDTGLAAAVDDPGRRVLVAQIDGQVLGYAIARTEELAGADVLGVVEDIYVHPEARGVGLGEALIGEVVRWCRARGCLGVDALALPGQRETKNFFERSGFSARKLVMHRSLVATPSRPGPETTES